MDMIYEIRRRHLVQKQTITEIAKDMGSLAPQCASTFLQWMNPSTNEYNHQRLNKAHLKRNSHNGLLKTPNLQSHAAAVGNGFLKGCKPSVTAAPLTACDVSRAAGNPATMVQSSVTHSYHCYFCQAMPASLTGAKKKSSWAVSCRRLKSHTSVWPIAVKCLWWPIPEKYRKWC